MKLTIASVLLAFNLASYSSAGTILPRWGKTLELNSCRGDASGAAYFMTNEPTGNYIIASDIGSDGKLNPRKAVYTGGLGGHANNGGGGDGLVSQGSIVVSSASNMLAVVNAGSNTISVFSFDPSNPTDLRLVGAPISSGGEFPTSVSFSKDGDMLCSLNGGEINGVGCFKVNSTLIAPMTQTQRSLGLNQTTPATGPPGSASQIFVAPDGKNVVVSVKGMSTSAPGYLAVWDIINGTLSKDFNTVPAPSGGQTLFGIAPIQGQQALILADPAIGYDIMDFSGQNRSTAVQVDGQMAICWITYSSKTGNYYMIDAGASRITEVNVDNNLKGNTVNNYSTGNNTGPLDTAIATIGGKDYIYTLAARQTEVNVMSLDGPGQAQIVQKLDIAGPASFVGLPINATNVQGMATFSKP
ncbi:hypothetical protein K435DRAFT_777889 [Dendrothele bispora CBS 962.96]|uniref:3-carboxymuconate cyclase n=1 Tax=Dendrothele bispora (strain CBS 962.96) TaxID=1314807 RepID=A0A4S8M6G5_DENBC|nr:hypothetical protein K435DRAFT_777889 [Dendrothele bispora CBS 962.96]